MNAPRTKTRSVRGLLRGRRAVYPRFMAVFVLIGGIGIAASLYTLVHQRLPLPFQNTYTVSARFTAADGLVSGIGQPVNVVGVKVGQVTSAHLQGGQAVVTMQIDADRLPRMYANASAVLAPITPLDDMEINLNPGTSNAGVLPSHAQITVGQTVGPAQLSDLLSSLDSDTRAFLTSLIASLDQATAGRGHDLQRVLDSLGPTANDVGEISRALAERRQSLAHLVTNLGIVSRAAADDHQLQSVVASGDLTLRALASQQTALRRSLAQLPGTLALTQTTLQHLQPFAAELAPTLHALTPAVDRLPATLGAIRRFSDVGSRVLAHSVGPFVSAAQPLAAQLAPAVPRLARATPFLSSSFQALEYLTNEVAYDPQPNGIDRGFLFWLDWTGHNLNSFLSFADANGGIGRGSVIATCYGLQGIDALQSLFHVTGLCPK